MKAEVHGMRSSSIAGLAGLLGLAALALGLPARCEAHSSGPLDQRGCHEDRRRGEYHCHLGEYRGLKFNSLGDFMQQTKAGKTVDQMRQEQGVDTAGEPTKEDEDEGWLSKLPFIGDKDDGPHDVGSGEVIMPHGIEERLRTLQDLHQKGLISEEEYASKRKEILGEL
jgi:hypothetical protein